jgi:hypothetical protein
MQGVLQSAPDGEAPITQLAVQKEINKGADAKAQQIVNWILAHKGVCKKAWLSVLMTLDKYGIRISLSDESYKAFRVALVHYILRYATEQQGYAMGPAMLPPIGTQSVTSLPIKPTAETQSEQTEANTQQGPADNN